MSMEESISFNWNKFNIPAWLITVILVAMAVGSAKGDVSNLKSENLQIKQDLKSLSEVVPAMQADLRTVKDSQAEMRQDIKTLLQRGR